MANIKRDLACSYFDFAKSCYEVTGTQSVCGVKPVVIKTGKCLFHTTGDHTYDGDWIDCYSGCLKHDPEERKRYNNRQESLERRRERAAQGNNPFGRSHQVKPLGDPDRVYDGRVPLPSINRLEIIVANRNRQAAGKELTKKLVEIIDSRRLILNGGLALAQIAQAIELDASTLRERLVKPKKQHHSMRSDFSFFDIVKIMHFLRQWDKDNPEL